MTLTDAARHAPNPRTDYSAWRAIKLAGYPTSVVALSVELHSLANPSEAELGALRARLNKTNMALARAPTAASITPAALLALGRRLGLQRLDHNPSADEQAVSRLQVTASGPAAEYIPYTNRPLNWHTDGYYNPLERAVRAWMLFCARPAAHGGENALLDPEIAYIRLRDRDPEWIAALSRPDALRIPAARASGRLTVSGPVFAWIDGHLAMRFSARARSIEWYPDPQLEAARTALTELFSSDDDFIFRHRLEPGEGLITNNVLHNRAAFVNGATEATQRLLYRLRYLDRANGAGSAPFDTTIA